MANGLSALGRVYFTGRRVRLTPKGTAKLLVPVTVLYGMILKLIALPGGDAKLLIEFETLAGGIVSGIFARDDVETLPVNESELQEDLLGRRVHFPRSSGIGIAFPASATDYGVIRDVRWVGGKVRLVVWVSQTGKLGDVPFVTPADFDQCDLTMRPPNADTG